MVLVLSFQNCSPFSAKQKSFFNFTNSNKDPSTSDLNEDEQIENPINDVPITEPSPENEPGSEENMDPSVPDPGALEGLLVNIRNTPLKAFPSAEGFGAASTGGRGGRVIFVTNTNDSGPGSLREAISQSGPRIVVFRVSGLITVKSSLKITNSNITIAGQTAPGDGISLRRDPNFNNPIIMVEANNVTIRFLRVRPGASNVVGCCGDGVSIGGTAKNIIFDHCSFGWAEDENIDTWYAAENITFQWSLFSEALAELKYQAGKPYGKGALFGGDKGNVSVHHNLFVHNIERSAMFAAQSGVAEFINNYVYNWKNSGLEISGQKGGFAINVIGNVYESGANSNISRYPVAVFNSFPLSPLIFLKDNYSQQRTQSRQLEWDIIGDGRAEVGSDYLTVQAPQSMQSTKPVTTSSFVVTMMPTNLVKNELLKFAGAYLPKRDGPDQRAIDSVKDRTGSIINHQNVVNGWPEYKSTAPPTDSDNDGLPDDWEDRVGLNKNNPKDGNEDLDGDGYLNIEEYLNELAQD